MTEDNGNCLVYSNVGPSYDGYPCVCCDCADLLDEETLKERRAERKRLRVYYRAEGLE